MVPQNSCLSPNTIRSHESLTTLINRLRSLDIWNFPESYTQPGSNFLKQLSNQGKLEDVKLSKNPSGTIRAILQPVQKVLGNNILQRKHENSQKDWMKIALKLESNFTLTESVHYGLFIHDTKIILPFAVARSLKIFDISKHDGKCVHTEECLRPPYGLCHSRVNESLNEVYVSFQDYVVLYSIEVEDTPKLTKLQTIHLNKPMLSISCGLTTIFSANESEAFVCSQDFNIEHCSPFKKGGSLVPFISSSSKSDYHCFSKNGQVVVEDRNNTTIFRSDLFADSLRGLAFDLRDNVMICNRKDKLKQIKYGGGESRDLKLDGISDSYNVVLHPTGEKMLVFGFNRTCCVYQIV